MASDIPFSRSKKHHIELTDAQFYLLLIIVSDYVESQKQRMDAVGKMMRESGFPTETMAEQLLTEIQNSDYR